MNFQRLRTHRVLATLAALVLVHLVPVHALCACPDTEGTVSCCEAMAEKAPEPAKDACCSADAVDGPAIGNAPCVVEIADTEAPAVAPAAPAAPAVALAPAALPAGVCLPCEVCPFRVVIDGSPPPPTTAAYLLHAAFLI
jgi:hypothetical protein